MAQRKTQFEHDLDVTELTSAQKKGISDLTAAYLEGLVTSLRRKVDTAIGRSAAALDFFIQAISQELSGTKYSENEKKKIAHGLLDITELLPRSLNSAQMVIAAARLLRIKEVQRVLGSHLIDITAKKIEKNTTSFDKEMADSILKLPIPEQLDAIHQLATLSSRLAIRAISRCLERRTIDEIIVHAQSQPHIVSYDPAVKALDEAESAMKKLVHTIDSRSQSPLIHYACRELQTSIDERHGKFLNTKTGDEIYNEGVSYGDPAHGRQIESASEEWFMEDIHLRDTIVVPMQPLRLPSESRELLHRIASDAVAVYDHTMTPQSVARVDLENLTEPMGASLALSSAILQNREVLELSLTQSLSRSILHFFPLFIIDQSPQRLAEVFAAQSTVMNREEWIQYFSLWKILLDERFSPDADKERATIELILIDKRLEPKMETMMRELFSSAQYALDAFSRKSPTPLFQEIDSVKSSPELNPFLGTEQEDIPLLLQHLHRPALRKVIESDLGISFEEIPLTSQIQLLRFLAGANKHVFKRFSQCMRFVNDFRSDFLRSFMAAAESPAIAQTILGIVEKLHDNPKKIKKIFAILRTITDAASSTGSYMRSQYAEKGDQDTIRKTIQRLLRKAKDVLDVSIQGKEGDIVESLSTVSSEILLLTSTFKTLRESGVKVPLSEIKSVDLSILKGDELQAFASNEGNWQKMESIYRSRYSDPKYPESFKQKLVDSLHNSIEKGNTTLYVVKHGEEVIAFCRFDQQRDGSLYFGSFVVDARYDNHKLGMALLEESLLKLGQTKRIEADCDPDSPAAKLYKKLGFHVTRKYTLEGVPSTHIVREPDTIRLQERVPA